MGVPSIRKYGSHLLFVTLTAPGKDYFGSANHRVNGKYTGNCPCGSKHSQEDNLLGAPINFDEFDYEKAVSWNAKVPELWRRFLIALERELPNQKIEYVKVVEIQRRGLFHIHAILRIEPAIFTRKNILVRNVIQIAIKDASKVPEVEGHKFGVQTDVKFAKQRPPKKRRGESTKDYKIRVNKTPTRNTFARYLAKYATKGMEHATEKGVNSKYLRAHHMKLRVAAMPASKEWQVGAFIKLHKDLRNNPEKSGTIEQTKQRIRSRGQSKIQSFGFSGQFLTKSKRYSTTFKAIREEALNIDKGIITNEKVALAFNS